MPRLCSTKAEIAVITASYLVETDPRFTDRRQWLNSAYMLEALERDRAVTHKRLGDGFYEQRLIREQILQLTGQRFLDGHTSDDAQYRALMNAGITVAEAFGLRPGVALTAEQMAQLTSDIVWLVEREVTLPTGTTERVLVPQVYVWVEEADLRGDGTLIADNVLDLEVSGDILNTGTLAEGADLPDAAADFRELLGEGHIVITLDPREGRRYQGIVELKEASLAACLEAYFAQSEQLPTRLWLAADEQCAAGLLLQQLPDDGRPHDPDSWERTVHLADTVRDEELLGLAQRELLHRLYHEETVRVFEPKALRFGCTCSRERIAQSLTSLGAGELREIVAEQQAIETECHFCHTRYRFGAAEVEGLIEAPDAPPPTLH